MDPGESAVDPDVDDATLVRLAQEGYLDAFEGLVERHGDRAYRVALRLVGDPVEAQDLTQDALVAAWEGLPHFRAEAAFSTWLYRIVTTRCLNALRRRRPTRELQEAAVLADDHLGPAESALRGAQADAVARAVGSLPPAQRIPLVLHQFEGLSYAEIAQVTDSTVPAVRSLLFRARRALAEALREWR